VYIADIQMYIEENRDIHRSYMCVEELLVFSNVGTNMFIYYIHMWTFSNKIKFKSKSIKPI
jgi:hypothetical protein